jgi:hypothetical protein
MEPVRTINAKPAAALFGGYLAVLIIGLLARYTSYDPDAIEAAAITGIAGFAASWIVPEGWWRRAEGEGVAGGED